ADRKVRLQTLPSAFVAPVAPGWGGSLALIAAAAVQAQATRAMPLDAVRPLLGARASEDMARTGAEGDLSKFNTELAKLGAQTDKSEARAYVEKFVKERGVQTGQS